MPGSRGRRGRSCRPLSSPCFTVRCRRSPSLPCGSRRCISQGHGGLHERVAREPSVSLFAARLITSGKGEQYQSEGRIRPALPRTSNTNTKTLPSRLRIPLFVQTLGGRSGTSVPLPDVKPPETGLRSLTKTFAPGPFDQIQQCSSGSNFSPAI